MDDEQIEYFSLNEKKFRVHALCHFCGTAINFTWMNETYTHLCRECSLYICSECIAETTTTFSDNLRRPIQYSLCTSCFNKAAKEHQDKNNEQIQKQQNKALKPTIDVNITKLVEQMEIDGDSDNIQDFFKMVMAKSKKTSVNPTTSTAETFSVNIKAMRSRLVDYYNQHHKNSEQNCMQKLQVESRIRQLVDANKRANYLQDSVKSKRKSIRIANANDSLSIMSNIDSNTNEESFLSPSSDRARRKARIVIPKYDEIDNEEIIPEDKKIRGRNKKQVINEAEQESSVKMFLKSEEKDKISLNDAQSPERFSETCVSIHPLKIESLRNNRQPPFMNTNKVDDKVENSKKSPEELERLYELKKAAKIKLMKKKCEKHLQYQKEHPEEFYKVKKKINK